MDKSTRLLIEDALKLIETQNSMKKEYKYVFLKEERDIAYINEKLHMDKNAYRLLMMYVYQNHPFLSVGQTLCVFNETYVIKYINRHPIDGIYSVIVGCNNYNPPFDINELHRVLNVFSTHFDTIVDDISLYLYTNDR